MCKNCFVGGMLSGRNKGFRWFKFILKPPNNLVIENFFLALWNTSHWNFFVKFGLKTPYDISSDPFWSILTYVNFGDSRAIQVICQNWVPSEIFFFLMKEQQVFHK